MVQEGVRHIISWPNSDRGGHVRQGLNGRLFWWLGPDGKSKVLFFQPGKYASSGSMGKGQETGRPWFGQRDPSKVPLHIQTGHANRTLTRQLEALEKTEIILTTLPSSRGHCETTRPWMRACPMPWRNGTKHTLIRRFASAGAMTSWQ